MASKSQKARGRELILQQLQGAMSMWAQQRGQEGRAAERKEEREYRRSRDEKADIDRQTSIDRNESRYQEGIKQRNASQDASARSRVSDLVRRSEQELYEREQDSLRNSRADASAKQKLDRYNSPIERFGRSGINPEDIPEAEGMIGLGKLSGQANFHRKQLEIAAQNVSSLAAQIESAKSSGGGELRTAGDINGGGGGDIQKLQIELDEWTRKASSSQHKLELARQAQSVTPAQQMQEAAGNVGEVAPQGHQSTSMDRASLAELYADATSLSKSADPNQPVDLNTALSWQRMSDKYGITPPLFIQQMFQGIGDPLTPPDPSVKGMLNSGGAIRPEPLPGIDARSY